jgi:diaminohydroxyphosphoribosylaminopyrimidine deaminase/5-amino-6-(5-phosphoribosylamino)uracil reductase
MAVPQAQDGDYSPYMARAVELARMGLGRTSPNPPVGAVVVREGEIVGEGFHLGPGGEHAEVVALRRAGARASGADLYVTLEPCCHQGRTAGCAQAVAAARVARVFYGASDPDRRVCGKGGNVLAAGGVEVRAGVMASECGELYRAYAKHRTEGVPLVTAKMAVSADGKVATRSGQSRWISGPESRQLVHRWRDEMDAVMVGVGTVLADDPALTCRREDRVGRDPLRVVVDSGARTPPGAQVVGPGCVVAVADGAAPERIEALRLGGAEVWEMPQGEGGKVDLRAMMARLGEVGVVSVLLEGGPTLLGGALAAGLVEGLLLFYAPKIIGGDDAPGVGAAELGEAGGWQIVREERIGADLLVEMRRCSQG